MLDDSQPQFLTYEDFLAYVGALLTSIEYTLDIDALYGEARIATARDVIREVD